MKVIFLKDGYYRNVHYEKGSIVEMSEIDSKAYIECKIVEIEIQTKRKKGNLKNVEDMSYRELQKHCRINNLIAVGTKEKLASSLKEKLNV